MIQNGSAKRMVKCPRCGNPSEFSSANPHRPFCSDRCKLIDLGDWASENFKIPAAGNSSNLDDESASLQGASDESEDQDPN